MKAKLFCLLLLALCLLCACSTPETDASSETAAETTKHAFLPGSTGSNQFSQADEKLPEEPASYAKLYEDDRLSVRLMYGLRPSDFGQALLLRFENRSGGDLSVALDEVVLNGSVLVSPMQVEMPAGKTELVSKADWLQALRICEEDAPTQIQGTVRITDGASDREGTYGVKLVGNVPEILSGPMGGARIAPLTLSDDESFRLDLLCLGPDPEGGETVYGVLQAQNKTDQAQPLRIAGLSLNGTQIRDGLAETEVPARNTFLVTFRFPASDLQSVGQIESAALTAAFAYYSDAEFSLSVTEDAP